MTRWVNFTLDPNFIIRIMVDSDPFGNIGMLYVGLVSARPSIVYLCANQ
jgi:hypothetical protein